jgi:hypothetical protein
MQCGCRAKQINDFTDDVRDALRISIAARQFFDARQKTSG